MDTEIEEVKQEIRKVEQEIRKVEQEIRKVEKEIEHVEEQLTTGVKDADVAYWRKKEEQLRQEKEQLRQEKDRLRKKEEQLREEKLVLLKTSTSGLSPGVSEKLLQDLTELMAQMKAKQKSKKSVRLSSASQSIWDTLERQEGLKIVYQDIDPEPRRLSDLAAFGWDDRQERSQADRYIPHMSKIAAGRSWTLIDAANTHPTLLSGTFGGWNFKGTTDVAFVHRKAYKLEPRRGLRGIFELKKNLGGGREKAVVQTLICLVMSNLLAQQFKPFAVLTDLVDHWSLYWMDGSTIHCNSFESRARAVGFIEELLQDSDDVEMGTSEALASHARPHCEDKDLLSIKKRRMYEPPGMDNLKDLVGLIPDEEILNARVQLGVQQLQKLLHEPLFSGVPNVNGPWPHGMYC